MLYQAKAVLLYTMNDHLSTHYTDQISSTKAEILRLRQRGKNFLVASLATFSFLIVTIVIYTIWKEVWFLGLAFLMLLAYILVRQMDIHNSTSIKEKENLRSVYEKELAYIHGDFSCFSAGENYLNPHHEYALDLDIFGSQSLFQRMNRTVTTGGSDLLASELTKTQIRTIYEIETQRDAIRELTEHQELCTRFKTHGQQKIIDTQHIMEALLAIRQITIPRFANKNWSLAVVMMMLTGLGVSIILAFIGKIAISLPIWWALVQFVVAYSICSKPLRLINKIVNQLHHQIQAYISLITIISSSNLQSKGNVSLIHRLTGNNHHALASFKELKRLLDDIDRRGNELWAFFSNALFMSDFFIIRRYLHWQDSYLMEVEKWIDAVSHFDALVSMATFRYNEPEAVEAEFVEEDKVVYSAKGLYHPFLGAKAIRNHFQIEDHHYYIITGANMAGKSTLLRAIGINYILACCGLPVFAEQLTVSVFSIFSSMRTNDDLAHGVSFFNAELLRLQQLITTCRNNHHTLIILDEILKGTNSLDKLNGSRLFLKSIASLPITGIVATHDLELSKMQEEYPDRFHNYCFEIQLSEHIHYSYRITEGVARNQNATYLLKKILNQ